MNKRLQKLAEKQGKQIAEYYKKNVFNDDNPHMIEAGKIVDELKAEVERKKQQNGNPV